MNKIVIISFALIFIVSALTMSMVFADTDDWDVEWTLVSASVNFHEYEIAIQNLNPTKQDFNLSVLFSDTNFPLEETGDVYLYEWKNLSYEEQVWVADIVCDDVRDNNTWYEVCTDYGGYQTQIGYKCDWKPTKMAMFKKVDKLNSDYTLINIPKAGSKPSDCTDDGTKWFKLRFESPIVLSEDGWGSSGKVAFLEGEDEYHPWFNDNWAKRKNVTFTSADTVDFSNPTVEFNLTGITISSGDAEREIRCTDMENTTLDLDIYETDNSTWAYIYAFVPSGRSYNAVMNISCYYDNAAAPAIAYTDHVQISEGATTDFTCDSYSGTVYEAGGSLSHLVIDGDEKIQGYLVGAIANVYNGASWYFGSDNLPEAGDSCTVTYDGYVYARVDCDASEDNSESDYYFYAYDFIHEVYGDVTFGIFNYLDSNFWDNSIMITQGGSNTTATGEADYVVNEPVASWGDTAGTNSLIQVWNQTQQAEWDEFRTRIDGSRVSTTLCSDSVGQNQCAADSWLTVHYYPNTTADQSYAGNIIALRRFENPLTYTLGSEETAPTGAAPLWFNNTTSYPANYHPSTKFIFNLTLLNGSADTPLNTSDIQFKSNFSNGTMSLISGDMWDGVYGYEAGALKVGAYWFYVKPYNNESVQNQTDTWTITISKASSNCTMSHDQSSPLVYGNLLNSSCYCDNLETQEDLWIGGEPTPPSNRTDLNNLPMTWPSISGGKNYSFVCNVSATENYTTATDSYANFTITQASNPINMWINDNLNQNATSSFGELLNVTVTQGCTQVGCNVTVWKNGTSKNTTNGAATTFYYNSSEPQGVWLYFLGNATGNNNYTDNATGLTYWAEITSTLTIDVLNELTDAGINFNLTIANDTFSFTDYDKSIFYANASNMPYNEISVSYWADGYTARTRYLTITPGSNETITLYLLPDADGQYVNFNTRNYYNVILTNTSLSLSRLKSGAWAIMAQGLTDDSGNYPIFLSPTASYRLYAYKSGYDAKNISLIPALTSYTIYLGGETVSKPSYWEFYSTLYTNCTFDNSTRLLNCTWVDVSGHVTLTTMNVITRNETGHEWYLCSNTSANSSGTFYCNFGTPNNQTFFWSLVMDTASEASALPVESGSWSDLRIPVYLGVTGILISVILVLFTGFLGVQFSSPTITVLLTIVGVIASVGMGILDLGVATATVVMGLGVSGGILMWKMRSDQK